MQSFSFLQRIVRRPRLREAALRIACVAVIPGCHDALGGGSGTEGGNQVLWRAPVEREEIWVGSPALAGSQLYVMLDHEIAAVDSRNGSTVWRTRVTRPPVWTENISIRQGRVFVAGADSVYALDESTGAARWRVAPDDSSAAGAYQLADERALYIGTRAHRLHALALEDGRAYWSTDLGRDWEELGVVQGISRSADTLYVSLTRFLDPGGLQRRGVVVAVDRRDGTEFWRYQTPADGSFDDAPAIAGRLVLLSDTDGRAFVGLDRATGRELWRTPTDARYLGPRPSPVVRHETAYGVSYDGYAYAVRVSDGHVLWRANIGASSSHLALCGGSLLAQSQGIAVVSLATGRLERVILDDPDDFTTSGIVVAGRRAYSAGVRAVYAFRCG